MDQNHSSKPVFKWVKRLLLALISIWLIGSIILFFVAPTLIFKIQDQKTTQPEIAYQEVFLKNKAGERLENWFIDNPATNEVILYLPGNIGRIPNYLKDLAARHDVFSPNYPGFGKSEGKPSIDNTFETAEIAYQELLSRGYKPNQITIWGHSLGGSPSIYLGTRHPDIKKIVLMHTFSSIQSMCFGQYSILCAFGGGFFNSAEMAKGLKVPVRQFHDKNDNVVPYAEGQKLYKYIGSADKKFSDIAGDHSNFEIAETLKD